MKNKNEQDTIELLRKYVSPTADICRMLEQDVLSNPSDQGETDPFGYLD